MAGEVAAKNLKASYSFLRPLIGLVLIVGILFAAKDVIVPLALAVLLAFILTPLVMLAQRLGLGRVPAVLAVVGLTLLLFLGVGWGVAVQMTGLARDVPKHRQEIAEKINSIKGSGSGPFSQLLQTLKDAVQTPVEPASSTTTPAVVVTPGITQRKPEVVIARADDTSLHDLMSTAGAVLEPLASAGLILILVVFMLIRREDLRNRMIGLLGHTRLTGTTRVLVEAAQRLSRLLLMQLAINSAFGLVFGLALLLIGVPYWLLWGFLAIVLRFIPYIGSWIAAALPLLLSFATSHGWAQPILVLVAFLGLDLTTANVIEPLLFGHSTGVTPVALLVAAVFWTWVWGPIGLVLSTPLTVCLVVLGQHVPRLRFLSLLLGEEPPLAPHVSYFQRLLANDPAEARTLVAAHARAEGIDKVPDAVVVPALMLARRDREHAGLSADDETFILDTTREILTELTDEYDTEGHQDGRVVLGLPAHHPSEELILEMLGLLSRAQPWTFKQVGTRTLAVEIEATIESDHPAVVFLAVLPPGGTVQARYLCRRLRRKFPELKIVVGYFGRVRDFDRLLVRMRAAGANYVTTTVTQSFAKIQNLLVEPAAAPAETSSAQLVVLPPAVIG